MASIPIHNETDYAFTEGITQQIIRDAQEHFGEEVRSIRVQSGRERHAWNARTHEVRYAFSPQDFGLGPTMSSAPEPHIPEPPRARRRAARKDTEPIPAILPVSFEDVAVDTEDMEPLETSLESLDEGHDEDDEDEEDDVFTLDDQHDEDDEDEDDEDEEEPPHDDDDEERFFDPDTYEA